MTCSKTLLATLALGATLSAAQLLVLNKEGNLAIVDPATGKVMGRVPVGESPHEVAASADGKLAFVSNYGSQTPGSTISVIDLAAQKELHRVDLGALRRPHGIESAGGKAYFTAETNRLIGRYDPATNQIDWLMGTGQASTHMLVITRDMNTIYTANIGSDSITAIERAGANWNQTVIPVGKGPEGFDLSPDEKTIWASTSRDGGVSIIDTASKKVTQTLNVGTKRSNRLKFTPDGKRALITDLDAGELVVMDVAARKEIKRIPVGKQVAGVLIVPDGSRAYVAATGDNFVAVVDLKTLEVTGKLQTGAGPDGMAWVK
jgi:YVTN family beta-propeller protein